VQARPRRPEILDALAVAMEDERHDLAPLLQPVVNREPVLEHLLDVGRERERARLAVLGRVWVQSHAAPVPIDVPPLQRKNLGRRPPAGRVSEADDVRELTDFLRPSSAVSVASSAAQMRAIWSRSRKPVFVFRSFSIGKWGFASRRPACMARLNARRSTASSG